MLIKCTSEPQSVTNLNCLVNIEHVSSIEFSNEAQRDPYCEIRTFDGRKFWIHGEENRAYIEKLKLNGWDPRL